MRSSPGSRLVIPASCEDISGAAILKSSSHQAEAQKFLAFLDSPAGQRVIAHSASFEYPLAAGRRSQLAATAGLKPASEPDHARPDRHRRRRPRPARAGRAAVSPVEAPVAAELPAPAPGDPGRDARRAVVTDRPLLVLAALVALAVLSPLLLVALQAQHAGWHELTTRPVAVALGDAAEEHGGARRDRRGARRRARHRCGVADRARGGAGAAAVGGSARDAGGDPRLRRRLRVALDRPEPGAAARRHAGDDARHLSARLPPGRGRAAPARPGARGDRTDARDVAVAHVHPNRAADAAGPDPRRRDARRADRDLGVRRVRDPRLPDVHDRGVHGVQVRSRRRRCARGPAGRARPARRARRGGAPAYRSQLGAPATPPTAARADRCGRRPPRSRC